MSLLSPTEHELATGARQVVPGEQIAPEHRMLRTTEPQAHPYLNRGDRVMYSGAWGTQLAMPGTILGHGVSECGEHVWDVALDGSGRQQVRWGYRDQFTIIDNEAEGFWPSSEKD